MFLLSFKKTLKKGHLLIDARLKHWFEQSTIPTAINIPFPSISTEQEILDTLGISKDSTKNSVLDFTKAKKLLIFDNGPWCPQASEAIKALVKLGYPKDKIFYYRGGMQYWNILGLVQAYPQDEKGEDNVQ